MQANTKIASVVSEQFILNILVVNATGCITQLFSTYKMTNFATLLNQSFTSSLRNL